MRGGLRGVTVDVDHDDGPAVAECALVRGEIDELVHQREVEGAPEPSEPARDIAGPVHAIRALLAAQELEIPVGEPGRLQLGQRRGRSGRIVDDGDEPIGRVADGAARWRA